MLERAMSAGRIVVTRDGRDVIVLARAWADEGRAHAGILVVWGFRSTAFGEIVTAVDEALGLHPDQAAWANLVLSI